MTKHPEDSRSIDSARNGIGKMMAKEIRKDDNNAKLLDSLADVLIATVANKKSRSAEQPPYGSTIRCLDFAINAIPFSTYGDKPTRRKVTETLRWLREKEYRNG